MPTVYMLIGLPGSGKSTVAEKLAKGENAVIVSTDKIREELFGDEAIQSNEKYDNNTVFSLAYTRTKIAMLEGKNIIFDATNINRKKRKYFLEILSKKYFWSLRNTDYTYRFHAILIATPYEKCLENNLNRRRVVPEEVIKRMMCNFEVPMKFEGWDEVEIYRPFGIWAPEGYHNRYYSYMRYKNNIPHDCEPWHTGTILEHIEAVKAAVENDEVYYSGAIADEFNLYYYVAAWHDVGKAYVKTYSEKKKRCVYYNHNNVSAYCYLAGGGDFSKIDTVFDIAFVIEKHMEAHKYNSDQECYDALYKQGIDSGLICAIIKFGDYDNAGALAVEGTELR